jgi:hypothetical protein
LKEGVYTIINNTTVEGSFFDGFEAGISLSKSPQMCLELCFEASLYFVLNSELDIVDGITDSIEAVKLMTMLGKVARGNSASAALNFDSVDGSPKFCELDGGFFDGFIPSKCFEYRLEEREPEPRD